MDFSTSCRICFAQTDESSGLSIYGNEGKIAAELFSISGVKVIDIKNSTRICFHCLNQLENAIKFRNICLEADQTIRKKNFEDEEKLWNKKLIALQCNALNEEIAIDVKCEPLIDESDNDQINVQGWNPDWYEEEEEEPVKKRKYKKRSKEESRMKRHKKRQNCSKCDVSFNSYKSLDRHINISHPIVGNLNCDICGKLYSNRKKMREHLQESHFYKKSKKQIQERKMLKPDVPCSICGKFFKDTYYLRKHEKLHEKLKPSEYLYCDLCGNKFKEKAALHTHIRFVHVEKRRFHCPKCPNRSWTTKHAVKRHTKHIHEGIKEFKCDLCNKEFHTPAHLKNHHRIHTGETPYQCKYCERKFIHQTDCRRHEWGHTGYKGNIKCKNCNQRFFKNSDLQSHLSRCQSTNFSSSSSYFL